jgi:hypothetical protein
MMVRRRIGIEIGFRSIDRDLAEKADFRELVQRVVNCCERYGTFARVASS